MRGIQGNHGWRRTASCIRGRCTTPWDATMLGDACFLPAYWQLYTAIPCPAIATPPCPTILSCLIGRLLSNMTLRCAYCQGVAAWLTVWDDAHPFGCPFDDILQPLWQLSLCKPHGLGDLRLRCGVALYACLAAYLSSPEQSSLPVFLSALNPTHYQPDCVGQTRGCMKCIDGSQARHGQELAGHHTRSFMCRSCI